MKKYIPYIAFAILTSLMLFASSCKSMEEGVRHASTTGCCSYTVYEDNCLVYEEDGYHRTYCGDQLTLEETIHEIEENCYKQH